MCDMGGLDNLVANTAYLKAKGVMTRKWRNVAEVSLYPSQNNARLSGRLWTRTLIPSAKSSLLEGGFFRQYLEKAEPDCKAAAEFLDDLNAGNCQRPWPKTRPVRISSIKFCKDGSKSSLTFLTGDVASKCKAVTDKDFEEVMGQVKEATKEFLKGKPFTDYQTSEFFDKFLQWKEYENQPITDKYFYEFRTLGKGGFGEVCSFRKVQSISTYF